MSRPIKFRAWDKKLNIMLSSEKIQNQVWSYGELINGMCGDCEIQQFTGLKDKNGKDIYEGDICKYDFAGIECIGEVTYSGASFSIYGLLLNQMPKGTVEVIGSIFDNKELLTNQSHN